jgi:antitoxin MazE
MAVVVKTKLVRIGNSRGIRVPRVILEQAGLSEELELEVRRRQLVVRSSARPRRGWQERFREMRDRGEDRLLWPEISLSSFDKKEWDW